MSIDMTIEISVVVCTLDRARDVETAIDSVVKHAGPDVPYELIVVDNGSTDDTRAVIEQQAAAHPAVRYILEPRVGLSHARNAGWLAARARIVAFLDDDAVAEPGWLEAVACAFHRASPDVALVGGRVIPVWEAPPPAWLASRPALGLTILDWSDVPKQITELRVEWLAGANMAVRRSALERAGGFHPALGRSGRRQLSSEDTYLQERLLRLGYQLWYDPSIRIRHRIPASRLTQEWFRRRYFWQGVSDAIMRIVDTPPSMPARLREAASRTRALMRRGSALLDLVRSHDDPARFEQVCWMLIDCGHIAGLLGAWRRRV